ncbi:hypothetical protein [Phormidium sp. FACHB-1136]|uniref:AbiU2 domain-containing protein n=1 Tax=Phormidium sp. FACHB-1136 TaxID=2692848 RepID=UPI0016820B94|nr:hypothetical protein [Phormidium sp. FACHB-1136]MBD2427361.1 hypothetical protein [Phormidium sp. FACHB-1136]
MTDNRTSIELFAKYLEIVELNLARASIYLMVQRKVEERLQQQRNAEIPNNIFLLESKNAFGDSGILLLCKVYEQDGDSVGLKKVVNYFEANHRFWSLENSKIETCCRQLIQDKVRLDENHSSLVKRLMLFRNKVIAHPGKDGLTREKKIIGAIQQLNLNQSMNPLDDILNTFVAVSTEPYPNFPHALTWQEIDNLIDIATEIFLKYKSLISTSDDDTASLKEGVKSDIESLVSALGELLD